MDRYIPANAPPFERFLVGDEVAHIILGDGVVKKNNGEYIVVQFKSRLAEFDAGWFLNHPRYLFHRGVAA